MLKFILLIVVIPFLIPAPVGHAQKSDLFSYDKEKVSSIMDQITEANTITGTSFAPKADSVLYNVVSDAGLVFIGIASGFAGIAGGFLIGLKLVPSGSAVTALIGGVLGIVVPALITDSRSQHSGRTRNVVFGSCIGEGMTVGITIIVLTIILRGL